MFARLILELAAIDDWRAEQLARIDGAAQIDAHNYGSREAALLMADSERRRVDDEAERRAADIWTLYGPGQKTARERTHEHTRER